MSTNTKIFQIYFKPELKVHCDPAFEPLDNTANPRPELREWDVWDREHDNILAQLILDMKFICLIPVF